MPNDQNRKRHLTPMIVADIAALILVLAIIAVVAGKRNDKGATVATTSEYGEITIKGTPLPKLDDPAADPAVGMTIPRLRGTSFTGAPVTVQPGVPTLLLFVAHWCPHCQREVPLITQWVKQRGGLGATRLVAVSTSVDAALPNFPASQWLRREGLPAEFIRDDASGTAATAFGLPGFPYFVAIDATGRVVGRNTGELPKDQFEALVALAEGKQSNATSTTG